MVPGGLFAQATVEEATRSAKADLSDALGRLSILRETIREEQIPLARELSALEGELREKREEAASVQRGRDVQRMALNDLERSLLERRAEIDYVSNLLTEYGRIFEVRTAGAERHLYADQLDVFVGVSSNLAAKERLMRMRGVATLGLDRLEDLIGGYRFFGQAVSPSGRVEHGQFLLLGPLVYFSSSETDGSGLALDLGGVTASYVPLGGRSDGEIRELVQAGWGYAPIDPTLGDAFALAETQENLWQHIKKGGGWIWPILVFGVLALGAAIFKTIEIYRIKMPAPGTLYDLLQLIEAGKRAEALERAAALPGPAGELLRDGVRHAGEKIELVEEVLYERMLHVQPKLERLLPFIAVTAATAPLMGLLGTVTGMINTFKLITIFGTGDAKNLSSGISEALVTTEFGLIVAIPSLIIHALLARRAQGLMATLERLGIAFINGLSRHRSEGDLRAAPSAQDSR